MLSLRNSICFLILLLSVILSQNLFAEEWRLTLDQALARAAEQNRDIKVAKERLHELEAMKGEALSAGLPQVAGSGQYQRVWRKPTIFLNNQSFQMGMFYNYSFGAQLNQLIFDGGRVFRAVKASRSELESGRQNIRSAEQQVKYEVKETYYNILYVEKVIDVLKKKIEELRSHLAAIKERYGKGIDSDYTLMRQDVEVSNVIPQLMEAEKNSEILQNSLKIILAIPQTDRVVLADPLDYRSEKIFVAGVLIERAKGERPDLAAEKLHQRTLEQVVKLEKTAYIPNLNFNTSWLWQGQSNHWHLGQDQRWDDLSSSLNLSWNIFDGLKTNARIQEAKAKLGQQKAKTSQFEDEVARNVVDAHMTLEKAKEALLSQQKTFALAKRATAIASERFGSGLMSQLELLDTINSQAFAEQQYYQALMNCLTAEAALELAVGGEI